MNVTLTRPYSLNKGKKPWNRYIHSYENPFTLLSFHSLHFFFKPSSWHLHSGWLGSPRNPLHLHYSTSLPPLSHMEPPLHTITLIALPFACSSKSLNFYFLGSHFPQLGSKCGFSIPLEVFSPFFHVDTRHLVQVWIFVDDLAADTLRMVVILCTSENILVFFFWTFWISPVFAAVFVL